MQLGDFSLDKSDLVSKGTDRYECEWGSSKLRIVRVVKQITEIFEYQTRRDMQLFFSRYEMCEQWKILHREKKSC